jgi:hypothetical protein
MPNAFVATLPNQLLGQRTAPAPRPRANLRGNRIEFGRIVRGREPIEAALKFPVIHGGTYAARRRAM